MKLAAKLAKWLIFSVLLALLPLALNYLHVLTRGGQPTLQNLLGKGELLLIAASISAAAVGSVIGSGKDWLVFKVFAAGGSVLILGLASLYFADIAAAPSTQALDQRVIAGLSAAFFVFSVLAGAGCIAFEEA